MKLEISSNSEVYKICRAERGLACWQNAVVNWFRLSIATDESPSIHFWHRRQVLHAYLEIAGRVYSKGVTWLDSSYPEITPGQLQELYAIGEVENITAPAITSQLDRAFYALAGHRDWRPVYKIENYVPELSDRSFLLNLADKLGYKQPENFERNIVGSSFVFNGL